MKKFFISLLFGAMVLGFSACEEGEWVALLISDELKGATATLSKVTDLSATDEVVLTITPDAGCEWQIIPSATVTNASLKSKSDDGNVFTFVFSEIENSIVITVTGLAVLDPINGHEYVDLGLPSGTLWATMNIGATKPQGYGSYFAWGETVSKGTYSWDTYTKFGTHNLSDEINFGFTKYNVTDKITVLRPEDDAARANWGGAWRIPTSEDMAELLKYCTWTWTTRDSIYGYEITRKEEAGTISNTNTSIFLPVAGIYTSSVDLNDDFQEFPLGLNEVGRIGSYWLSTLPYLSEIQPEIACCLLCGIISDSRTGEMPIATPRCFGLSVRAVLDPIN